MSVDIAQIPDAHLPDRTGTIRDMLRVYPDATHIISEFIQNAEDVNSRKIQFEVSRDKMRIDNDGDAFSTDNYRQLVVFAQGKWGERGKIGRFGVGFLSAYHITDSPMVLSNGVRLVIGPDGRTSKSKHRASDGRKGSTFILPLRKSPTELSARLGVKEVTDESIRRLVGSFRDKFHRCVLFLGGERMIEGWERNNANHRLVCRCTREVLASEDITGHHGGVITYERVRVSTEWLKDKSGSKGSNNAEWLVFSQDFEEDYVRTYGTGAPGKTKVSLAFKLRDRSPDEVGYLHAFLPTRIRTGLQFNLNADFFPRTGRDDIMEGEGPEAGWNEWLIDCLGRLSVAVVDQLKEETATPADFYDIVPVECAEERPYLMGIVDQFVKGVKDSAVVYSQRQGWQTRHDVYRADAHLRSIVARSRLKLVSSETQDGARATKLFDLIDVRWLQTRDLVELLKDLPRQCSLRRAPAFASTYRRLGMVYRYLDAHRYDDMWDELKNVSLCPDQFDVLHPFDCSSDRVFWADSEMRRILAQSGIALIKERLWNSHRTFLKKLVPQFGMDDLIDHLNSIGEGCGGKKLQHASTPVINSLPKILRIYSYLSRKRLFETSKHKDGALVGTPLCIAEDDTVYEFDTDSPIVYLAAKGLREMMSGSKVSFIKLELQQRYRSLLIKAGVPELDADDVILLVGEGKYDGIPMKKAPAPLNTSARLLQVCLYLSRTKLSQGQMQAVKSTSFFLTSGQNLRPLVGGDQGALVLRSGRVSDPLNLDNLLHDSLSRNRRLRKWLRDCLGARELDFETYISDYVIPQYPLAPEDIKLDVLRMLRGNLKAISQNRRLQGLLRSAPLVRCQDGEYMPGHKLCFKKKSIDVVFADSYHHPSQTYRRDRRSRHRIKKEDWGELFTVLGVRHIPDSESVIRAARLLAERECMKETTEGASRLLRFIGRHWQDYEAECDQLKEMQSLHWLPAEDDWTQLYSPDALHVLSLKHLVGTQARFLGIRDIDESLAQFLGVHTKAETHDLVRNLLELSMREEPADYRIYQELDRRRDFAAIRILQHRDVVDLSTRGDFWNADDLFWGECSADFGTYRQRLPNRLRQFTWLFENLGVRPAPETDDYVKLLLEISDKYAGERLPDLERALAQRAYTKLARNLEDVTEQQFEELKGKPVVLGTDGRLHKAGHIFINDYPGHTELGFDEDPVFCVGGASVEEFLKRLPVEKFSRVVCASLISVENERLDETRTRLMSEIWLEPILRVNLSLLDDGDVFGSHRELLSRTELCVAERIRVRWSYRRGDRAIPSAVLDTHAFYAPPLLYFRDGEDGYVRLQISKELARVLAPEADPRTLELPYEMILSHSTPDGVSDFVRIHGYRSLPVDQYSFPEDDTAGGPTPSDEGNGKDTSAATSQDGDGPQPGMGGGQYTGRQPSQLGQHPARQVAYVDTSRLMVVEESSAGPDEAKPFSIGASATRRRGYTSGGKGGEGASFSDENMETEAIAFELIKKYEGKSDWNTDDNAGRGFTGYDILARRGKETKYIEVKSSRGLNCPDLSFPQLMEAKRKRHKYYLYRVLNLERSESSPVLYIIQDPWGHLDLDISGYTTRGYRDNPKGLIKKVVLQES